MLHENSLYEQEFSTLAYGNPLSIRILQLCLKNPYTYSLCSCANLLSAVPYEPVMPVRIQTGKLDFALTAADGENLGIASQTQNAVNDIN